MHWLLVPTSPEAEVVVRGALLEGGAYVLCPENSVGGEVDALWAGWKRSVQGGGSGWARIGIPGSCVVGGEDGFVKEVVVFDSVLNKGTHPWTLSYRISKKNSLLLSRNLTNVLVWARLVFRSAELNSTILICIIYSRNTF